MNVGVGAEYHIFPKSAASYYENRSEYHRICTINSKSAKDAAWEWAWWKRKNPKHLKKKLDEYDLRTYGTWDMLNNDDSVKKNEDKKNEETRMR